MLWNMAWRQVNVNDTLRTHTYSHFINIFLNLCKGICCKLNEKMFYRRVDGLKVELHFDQVINYKISPLTILSNQFISVTTPTYNQNLNMLV